MQLSARLISMFDLVVLFEIGMLHSTDIRLSTQPTEMPKSTFKATILVVKVGRGNVIVVMMFC